MNDKPTNRRGFLADGLRVAGAIGLAGFGGFLAGRRGQTDETLWQIDPAKCIACGNCATHCVLDESAVKCVHSFPMCGFCDLCTGYFEVDPNQGGSAVRVQLCPTAAIVRSRAEGDYWEYAIDEQLCIACGKCVKGCSGFGNGSLHLQVRHDRCVHCNECSIALACPSQAFFRTAAGQPYRIKHENLG